MATHTRPAPETLPVTLPDVQAAHARIADQIVRTPTFISKTQIGRAHV